MTLDSPGRSFLAVTLAALAAVSMWLYVKKVLVPYPPQKVAALEQPRGNFSDLYPRWLGARELLLRGRSPYSQEVTREIQRGYYGRELEPLRESDPKDQAGFAYPVYVVFLLAPFVHADFAAVRVWAEWIFGALALASLLLWRRVLGLQLSILGTLVALLLLFAFYPFVEAVSLQQPVLLVMALLAASFFFRNEGWLFLSGALMAVATIKPQTVVLPVILMLMWVSWNWRARRRWLWGFGSTMLVLMAGAQYLLPGWLTQFYGALRAYQVYMSGNSSLDLFLSPHWAWLGRAGGGIASVWLSWKSRGEPEASVASRRALSVALVAAVVTAPNLAKYSQILLTPGALLIAEQWNVLQQASKFVRGIAGVVLAILAWEWITAAALVLWVLVFHASWTSYGTILLPLFGALPLPLVSLALLFALPTTTGSAGRSLNSVPRGVSC